MPPEEVSGAQAGPHAPSAGRGHLGQPWAQRRAVLPGSAVLLEKGVSEEVGALWAAGSLPKCQLDGLLK